MSSILMNLLAIFLVYKHSHQNIGDYRYILFSFLIFNVFFSIVNSVADVEPRMASHSLILIGAVDIPDEGLSITLIYMSVFIFSELVIRPERTVIGALAVLLGALMLLSIWIVWFMTTSITTSDCVFREDSHNYTLVSTQPICSDFITMLQTSFDLRTASFVSIPFEIFTNSTTSDMEGYETNAKAVVLFVILIIFMLGSIAIVFSSNFFVLKKIRNSTVQATQRRISSELTRTLLGQALTPILLLQVPLLIASSATVIDNNFNWIYQVLYFSLAWFPTAQPLMLIIGVANYRKALIQLLHYVFGNVICRQPILVKPTASRSLNSHGGFSVAFGRIQRVTVDGEMLCNGKPYVGAIVSMMEKDVLMDDELKTKTSVDQGLFMIRGEEAEFGTIEPYLKIVHKCPGRGKKSKSPCGGTTIIDIPAKYINGPWFRPIIELSKNGKTTPAAKCPPKKAKPSPAKERLLKTNRIDGTFEGSS
ncbi:unnamed protein product, partial [Mesorhabditis spiculigera]